VSRYREVVPELSGEDYRRSAHEAFSRMEPEERAELGKQLRDQSLQQGYDFPKPSTEDGEDAFREPDYLTQLTAHMRHEHPDLLEGLIGDGGGGLVGGMMGEGITGGEGVASDGGMLGNPVAKAALAGIAAIGFKKMTVGR
jgi:hypothetical protein